MTGFAGCCARAAHDKLAAAPPISVMNSRRLIIALEAQDKGSVTAQTSTLERAVLPQCPLRVKSRHLHRTSPCKWLRPLGSTLLSESSTTSVGAHLREQDEDVKYTATNRGYSCGHIGPSSCPQDLLNSSYLLTAPDDTMIHQ